ncbi:PepSY domain-containing protein [Christiangramia sp. SM2212]|uniref:PepSY domain-containing protein n=1 Tax=Christiangramia sediminicola TaxID=3073267 RepID=A0ABU1ET24_9FLAO|nr:PepSY domain-containing protein [Christiangramia sp. SM2212]MDR5591544.1 PepSY domain-containing protein [Christiangramia sp. SM2212]
MNNRNISNKFRIYHRYLGFFLAGIMAMYAISGIVLIFRNTDAFKIEKTVEKEVASNLSDDQIGKTLRIKDFKIERTEGDKVYFEEGVMDRSTGIATYKVKQLPVILESFTKLHKANTNKPLFFLNIIFGLCLLFFVISAFWMFMPSTKIFRKGIFFTIGGIILTLILLLV